MSLKVAAPTLLDGQAPLFSLARKGIPEIVISGLSYYKSQGEAAHGSDPAVVLVARSLLKPWQFLAAAELCGEETFAESYWALGLASHSGQQHHLDELKLLSDAAGAGEAELVCPRCFPLDSEAAFAMRAAGIQPSRLHHPCAGKHLVALLACRKAGIPLAHYWGAEHPLQKRVASLLGNQLGEKPLWVIDSCGMPSIAVSVKAQLNLWERLATAGDPRTTNLRRLWRDNVRLVGGYGRLESDLMEVAKGRVLAKEGADGLLVVTALPENGQPATTCLIKLASGYNATYLSLALWARLSAEPHLPPALQVVADFLRSRLEKWVPGDQELVLPPSLGRP